MNNIGDTLYRYEIQENGVIVKTIIKVEDITLTSGLIMYNSDGLIESFYDEDINKVIGNRLYTDREWYDSDLEMKFNSALTEQIGYHQNLINQIKRMISGLGGKR